VVTLHNKVRPPFTEQDADIAGTLAAFGYERLCSQRVTAVLEQREQQYYLLERNIQDAFWLTDAAGYFTYASPSSGALLGLPTDALAGRHALETVAPTHRSTAMRVLIEARREGCAAQSGVQQSVELRHRNATGEDRWLETRVGPLRDAAGQLQGYVGVSRDITDRKRLELEAQRRAQHLLQADKLVSLGTLVGGIAHEINNANHLIMASTALLQQGWPGFESLIAEALERHATLGEDVSALRENCDDTPVLIEHIAEGASRIKRIVSDLRDFARGDTARLDQAVDLGVVAEQSLRIVAGVLHKSSIQLRKQYRDGLPPVRGNMVRLEQVVIHLLQNAIQAMGTAGGELTVQTDFDPARGTVVLEVRDRGSGIAEESLRQIFDPFFTTKRDLGCAGLGLSVASAIVQQHAGQLDVENQPGGGVCARLSLPEGAQSSAT
jgi:PAS domain S-box-containing protein